MWFLLLALFPACHKEADSGLPQAGSIDAPATHFEPLDWVLPVGTASLPVLARNDWNAPAAGSSLSGVSLEVSGTTAALASGVLEADPWGYAELEVTTSAAERFSVIPLEGGALAPGEKATAWAVDPAELPGAWLAWPPVEHDVRWLVGVSAGTFELGTYEAWFQPAEPGAQPYLLVGVDSGIEDARAVAVDGDGNADLLLRGDQVVLLLRGRDGGGAAWGTAFAPPEGASFFGAFVGDLDGDREADLALGLSDGQASWVAFLQGDGEWGFEPTEELPLTVEPTDLLLADVDGDGVDELLLLDEDAQLLRYARGAEGWAASGLDGLDTHLEAPARFIGSGDLDGDGTEDVAIAGRDDTDPQDAVIYLFPSSGPTRFSFSYPPYDASVGDLTGDGLPDVLFSTEGELHVVTSQDDAGEYDAPLLDRRVTLPWSGPVAAVEQDGGGLPELLLAGWEQPLRRLAGPPESLGGAWSPEGGDWKRYELSLSRPELSLLDGEPPRIAGFAEDAGRPVLALWELSVSGDEPADTGSDADTGEPGELPPGLSLRQVGRLELDAEPLGLASCEGTLYALLEGELLAVRPDDPGTLADPLRREVEGELLACGHLPYDAAVAVGSGDGASVFYDAQLQEVGTTVLEATSALAAADLDDDGVDELQACSLSCEAMTALRLEGPDLVARWSPGFIESHSGEESPVVESQAAPAERPTLLSAATLGGRPVVLASSGQDLWIYPVAGDRLAPAWIYALPEAAEGAVRLVEQGEGPVLLVPGEGGSLLLWLAR